MRRLLLMLLAALALLIPAAVANAAYEYDIAANTTADCNDIGYVSDNAEGEGCLNYGGNDNFYIQDLRADGLRVGIQWKNKAGTRWGLCVLTRGVNTKGVCDKEFQTNPNNIFWRVGACDGSTDPCSSPAAGWFHWSDWAPYPPPS